MILAGAFFGLNKALHASYSLQAFALYYLKTMIDLP